MDNTGRQDLEQDNKHVGRYVTTLLLGFIIMAVAAVANAYGLSLPTKFLQPNPADVDAMIEVNTPFPPGFTEFFGLALGGVINLYSVRKYANESYSIMNQAPPRRRLLIIVGLFATLIVIVLDVIRLMIR